MYTFSSRDLDDKIKYAKPFSFYESIREKFKKANLEENFLSMNDKKHEDPKDLSKKAKETKEIYENNLLYMSKLYSKVNKSNDKIERKSKFITESFNRNVFEEKMNKDLIYFKYLIETILPKNESNVYKELHETTLDLFKDAMLKTIELYEETNVKPRYLSPSLNAKEIEESRIVNIYNANFEKFLTENYIMVLRKGTQELNETEDIKKLTKYLIENGIEENIDNIVAYLPFEKRVKEFLENILIPEPAKNQMNLFLESQDLAYFDIFENNVKTLQESFDGIMEKIASVLSPFMFSKKVDIDSDIDPVKYAGVSMVCKKIDDGPMVCKMGEEDKKDAEEDIENVDDIEKKVDDIAEEDAKAIKDELEDDLDAKAVMGDDDIKDDDDIKIEDVEDIKDGSEDSDKEDKEEDKEEDKDSEKSDNKKKDKLEETEAEPGVDKTIPYNKNKFLKTLEKEEIVPDESSNFTKLDSQAKEEK